jgi:1,4-alpha-glucan branching enzyme
MVELVKSGRVYSSKAKDLYVDIQRKILVYKRGDIVFAFNFNPTESFDGYYLRNLDSGRYRPVLSTDEYRFGGEGRLSMINEYSTYTLDDGSNGFPIYLPAGTAICLKVVRTRKK